MNTALYVQVFKNGQWCKVTTISIDAGNNRLDERQKYVRAYREALSQLAGWRGYFKEPLRIAIRNDRGEYQEARR